MITADELAEMKTIHQRMGQILARVEAIEKCCKTCVLYDKGVCSDLGEKIPDDYKGPCDNWDFVPF